MSRLIIHIGLHKTGSTAIQNVLGRSKDLLHREGVLYPLFEGKFYHHGLVDPWITLPAIYNFADPMKAWKDLADLAHGEQTVIVSSEEFSRLQPSAVDYREVRRLTSAFGEVKIVLVVRHQLQYMQSIYLEVSKGKNVGAFSPFLTDSIHSGYCTGVALDYCVVLDHLEQGFSRNNIRVMSYDTLNALKIGLVKGFLGGVGITPELSNSDLHSMKANVSADPLAVWMANIFDASVVARPETVKQWAQGLRRHFGDHQQLIYTRSEADFVCQRYVAANTLFAQRVSDHNPDFVMPAGLRMDQAIYREDVTPDVWSAIGTTLQGAGTTTQEKS